MDAAKLAKLRKKYSGAKAIESEDLFDNKVPYAGVPTLLDMPHHPQMENLDIALIGVPFDLGVYNRAGARLGPRAIRKVTLFGSFNHLFRLTWTNWIRATHRALAPLKLVV